jgi:hypothetical protein
MVKAASLKIIRPIVPEPVPVKIKSIGLAEAAAIIAMFNPTAAKNPANFREIGIIDFLKFDLKDELGSYDMVKELIFCTISYSHENCMTRCKKTNLMRASLKIAASGPSSGREAELYDCIGLTGVSCNILQAC